MQRTRYYACIITDVCRDCSARVMERTLRKTVAAFINDHREAEEDPLATGGACAEVTGSTIHRRDGGGLKGGTRNTSGATVDTAVTAVTPTSPSAVALLSLF